MPSVLSLTSAKTHLNITVATYDTELQDVIDAAEAAIAAKCGYLASTSVTERVRGGRPGLVLRHTPAISLTSVTPVNGTAYDVTLLTFDNRAGVVEWTSGMSFTPGLYDVVYAAGRASVPDDLELGIKELVRHVWQSQRGGTTRPGSKPSPGRVFANSDAAYTFPIRVSQLLAPHVQVGN